MDLEIFSLLVENQSKRGGVSADELAEWTGAQKSLIGMPRFMMITLYPADHAYSPTNASHDLPWPLYLYRPGGIPCQREESNHDKAHW